MMPIETEKARRFPFSMANRTLHVFRISAAWVKFCDNI